MSTAMPPPERQPVNAADESRPAGHRGAGRATRRTGTGLIISSAALGVLAVLVCVVFSVVTVATRDWTWLLVGLLVAFGIAVCGSQLDRVYLELERRGDQGGGDVPRRRSDLA